MSTSQTDSTSTSRSEDLSRDDESRKDELHQLLLGLVEGPRHDEVRPGVSLGYLISRPTHSLPYQYQQYESDISSTTYAITGPVRARVRRKAHVVCLQLFAGQLVNFEKFLVHAFL